MSTLTAPHHIRTVGVIGAGLSGIVSAVYLLREGINVTIFERADSPGGAWKFSPQTDRDPPFPNIRPPAPNWDELERLQAGSLSLEDATIIFDPPGPVYANMKSRGREETMRTSLEGWPEGTRAPFDHTEVVDYLQRVARVHHVHERILFRTRVESVLKSSDGGQWQVQTSRLAASSSGYALSKEQWSFDAIVVASGRYGPPRVPDIPGLSEWKRRFPGRVTHSKHYRLPEPYRNKTVLVVGGHISALEITNELINNGAHVYQTARDTRVDLRDHMDHENAEKVAMVAEFTLHGDNTAQAEPGLTDIDHQSPIPGEVILEDGRILDNIQNVIISTGYLTTFPFLGPLLEQPSTALQDADETVIITSDARTVHNLHEDIFYIPDTSLAFIGVSQLASTFALFDVQAQVLAAVFAGKVRLPSKDSMQAGQRDRKSRLIPGTLLNSIFLLNDFVVERLMRWVNKDLMSGGFASLAELDPTWWVAFRKEREGARSLLGDLQDNYLGTYGVDWHWLESDKFRRPR